MQEDQQDELSRKQGAREYSPVHQNWNSHPNTHTPIGSVLTGTQTCKQTNKCTHAAGTKHKHTHLGCFLGASTVSKWWLTSKTNFAVSVLNGWTQAISCPQVGFFAPGWRGWKKKSIWVTFLLLQVKKRQFSAFSHSGCSGDIWGVTWRAHVCSKKRTADCKCLLLRMRSSQRCPVVCNRGR